MGGACCHTDRPTDEQNLQLAPTQAVPIPAPVPVTLTPAAPLPPPSTATNLPPVDGEVMECQGRPKAKEETHCDKTDGQLTAELGSSMKAMEVPKENPPPPLTQAEICKRIREEMKSPVEDVNKLEATLGPYEAVWEASKCTPVPTWEKKTTDEQGSTYYGYWNPTTKSKEGYGQLLHSNGAKYEGLFKDGVYEGSGRLLYANGDYYVGDWKNGKAEGKGTFVTAKQVKYTGDWQDSQHHGYGKPHAELIISRHRRVARRLSLRGQLQGGEQGRARQVHVEGR